MVIVVIDGKPHEVKGRLAEMIIWLIRSADRISNGSSGIRFSYRGPQLKVVVEHEETIDL